MKLAVDLVVEHFVEQVVGIAGEAVEAAEGAEQGLAARPGRALLSCGEEEVEALQAGAEAADVACGVEVGGAPGGPGSVDAVADELLQDDLDQPGRRAHHVHG